jgi:hypothetical protein
MWPTSLSLCEAGVNAAYCKVGAETSLGRLGWTDCGNAIYTSQKRCNCIVIKQKGLLYARVTSLRMHHKRDTLTVRLAGLQGA